MQLRSMVPPDSALGYGLTTLGATALSLVFSAFYVSTFVHWGITDEWFQRAQLVFMVWNAINDPLFAFLQDRPAKRAQDNRTAFVKSISWGGPWFALSFLLPWLPLGHWLAPLVGSEEAGVGLHFCISICLFDGMFTFVVLAQCGLFAELEASQYARSIILTWSQVATAFASIALFVAYPLVRESRASGSGWFSAYSVTLAAFAAACFYGTGQILAPAGDTRSQASISLEDRYDADEEVAQPSPGGGARDSDAVMVRRAVTTDLQGAALTPVSAPAAEVNDSGAGGGSWWGEALAVGRAWLGVVSLPDFLFFVVCNFLQIFDKTLNSALYTAAMPAILGKAFSDMTIGGILGSGVLVAPLLALALTPVLLRIGHSYPLIRGAFLFKTVLAALVAWLTFGADSEMEGWRAWLAAGYMVVHPAVTIVTFGWFSLSVSDIIDLDLVVNRRPRKLATSVFGLNALLTKPAESLAPMLFAPVLHTFSSSAPVERLDEGHWWASLLWLLGDLTPTDGVVQPEFRSVAAWRLVWGVPLVCGMIQLLLWSCCYSLREARRGESDDGDTTKD
jgi:Na+/melibiose symporter-like transporter